MIHPDYQYDSRLVPQFVGLLQLGVCDVLLGNRIRTRQEALACGMPVYKYVSNRALTVTENILTGQNLGVVPEGWRNWWQEHGVELVRREQARERGNQEEAEDLIDQAEER